MPRSERERLQDALAAAQAALSFTEGMTLDAWQADPRTVAAVKYELLVFGEALGAVPTARLEQTPGIPWAAVRALRNVIVHEYFRVDLEVLYQVVTRNLPEAVTVLDRLLEES